jgi:16S rRNA pseudouridine516 synthase
MRIDKYLSDLKIEKRSIVKKYLLSHEVIVNGSRVTSSDYKFEPSQSELSVNGKIIPYIKDMHLVIYKPCGYLSAHKDLLHQTVFSLLEPPYDHYEFKIAGRLDLDAEGLLILTTDGKLVHEITHPKKHLDKVYEVILDKDFIDQDKLLQGVIIKDDFNQPYLATAKDVKVKHQCVTITIDTGKFHQVKRMFQSLGYDVIKLKRTKIGNLDLRDLKEGTYYPFRKEEL